ncbi:hypothetical protein CR513_47672, partial [Mucuna pruriens]
MVLRRLCEGWVPTGPPYDHGRPKDESHQLHPDGRDRQIPQQRLCRAAFGLAQPQGTQTFRSSKREERPKRRVDLELKYQVFIPSTPVESHCSKKHAAPT